MTKLDNIFKSIFPTKIHLVTAMMLFFKIFFDYGNDTFIESFTFSYPGPRWLMYNIFFLLYKIVL